MDANHPSSLSHLSVSSSSETIKLTTCFRRVDVDDNEDDAVEEEDEEGVALPVEMRTGESDERSTTSRGAGDAVPLVLRRGGDTIDDDDDDEITIIGVLPCRDFIVGPGVSSSLSCAFELTKSISSWEF